MSYNVVEYVVWWLFYGLQDGEKKWQIYLKPFSCYPPEAYRRMYTHGQADDSYRQQCNVLHVTLKKVYLSYNSKRLLVANDE